jgi:hypothetical protein
VKIPPRAVLSYPNVFGTPLADHAGRQRIPQWGIESADSAKITGSQQQRREVRDPPDAVSERSGDATSPTSAGWLSLVDTGSANIDENSAAASLALSLALLNELCVFFWLLLILLPVKVVALVRNVNSCWLKCEIPSILICLRFY